MKYYIKCPVCLVAVCIDQPVLDRRGYSCGVCGHLRMEVMGHVRGSRVEQDTVRCKCDGRCVHAQGPICDCQCGGENHGAGMAGYVETTVDVGPLKVTPQRDYAKHLAWATIFRKALTGVAAQAKALTASNVDHAQCMRKLNKMNVDVRKAVASRDHKWRMTLLSHWVEPQQIVINLPPGALVENHLAQGQNATLVNMEAAERHILERLQAAHPTVPLHRMDPAAGASRGFVTFTTRTGERVTQEDVRYPNGRVDPSPRRPRATTPPPGVHSEQEPSDPPPPAVPVTPRRRTR